MKQKTFHITIKKILKNKVVDFNGREFDRDFFSKITLFEGQQIKLINKFNGKGFNSVRIISFMRKNMTKVVLPIEECKSCKRKINPERGIFIIK